MGIAIMVVWSLADWIRLHKVPKFVTLNAGAIVVFILMALSFKQASYWQNGITLWNRVLDCYPANPIAENNLGVELQASGKLDEAREHYLKTLLIDQTNLVTNHSEYAHCNLGLLLFREGRIDDAIAEYHKALMINPHHLGSRINLGNAFMKKGSWNEAFEEYKQACFIDSHNTQINLKLSEALVSLGREKDAIEELENALRVENYNPVVQNNLAWLLVAAKDPALRDGKRALALAESANRATGGESPEILETLAATQSAMGECAVALVTARNALEKAQKAGNKDLVMSLQQEISLYDSGKPFKELR